MLNQIHSLGMGFHSVHFTITLQLADLDYNAINRTDTAFPGLYNGTRSSHGTACAGIVAMEKSNDVCGVGVAYNSKITGK